MGSRTRVAAASLAAAVLLAGCAEVFEQDDLEEKVTSSLAKDAGQSTEGVTTECPDDVEVEEGNTFECTLTDARGREYEVNGRVTDDEGGFRVAIPPAKP
jgi:hypothetical protein